MSAGSDPLGRRQRGRSPPPHLRWSLPLKILLMLSMTDGSSLSTPQLLTPLLCLMIQLGTCPAFACGCLFLAVRLNYYLNRTLRLRP